MLLSSLKLKLMLFMILLSTVLYPSIIDINQTNISLLEHSNIYLDDKNLTLKTLIKKNLFKPYLKDSINIGTSKQTVWVKLTFENKTQKEIKKIILIFSIFLEHITFYDSEGLPHPLKKGQGEFDNLEKTLYDYYPIKLAAGKTTTVYLKVYSNYVPLRFILSLENKRTYLKRDYIEQIIDVFLIGFIFALMLYSLFLSLYIKDKSYFFYSAYLFILLYDQSRFVGLSHLFFSETLMLFDLKITIIRIYLLIITSSLFTINFLQIQLYPTLYKGYMILIGLSTLAIVFLDNTQSFGMNLAFFLILFISIYNLMVGIYIYSKGQKQARLYILGFSIVFISYMVIIMDISGIISLTQEFQNILLWSTAIEALILSLAFADRYMILQREKENVTEQYLTESQNRKNIIEAEVKRKTAQLNEALESKKLLLKEVHHRVKNNLHIILSMIQLQHNSDTQEYETLLLDLENRINAITKTYDMLIVNEDLQHIDMRPYIEHLLNDIQESFAHLKYDIDFHTEINATLPLKEAVYVGLIINETITNSYKYAFKTNKGTIHVSLIEKNKKYILNIKDSGVGFKNNKEHSSLGMKLIQTLAKEQLYGTFNLDTSHGVHYKITFKL